MYVCTTPQRIFDPEAFQAANGEDTLVFIGIRALGSFNPRDCGGTSIEPCIMTVFSSRLITSGSPVFIHQLSPEHQKHLKKRHCLSSLPKGINFILDLTLPDNSDEIGPQVALLTLTPALAMWAGAAAPLGVPDVLFTGHDDGCRCDLLTLAAQIRLPGGNFEDHYKKYEVSLEDYSYTRHFCAIVRLMMVIKGHGLVIDSAHRLWTMVGVAHIFGCTSLIRYDVWRWLTQDKNRNFVVYLPEEALVIGHRMRLPDVVRAAFSILTNELAIDILAKVAGNAPIPWVKIPEYTAFGRKRHMDVLDDGLQYMVLEAARRRADTVRDVAKVLFPAKLYSFNFPGPDEHDIFTMLKISEWTVLRDNLQLVKAAKSDRGTNGCDEKVPDAAKAIMDALQRHWFRHLMAAFTQQLETGTFHFIDTIITLGGLNRCYTSSVDDLDEVQKFLSAKTWLYIDGQGFSGQPSIGKKMISDFGADGWNKALADHYAALREGVSAIDPYACKFNIHKFAKEVDAKVSVLATKWLKMENDILRGLPITKILALNVDKSIFRILPMFTGGENDDDDDDDDDDDKTDGVCADNMPSTGTTIHWQDLDDGPANASAAGGGSSSNANAPSTTGTSVGRCDIDGHIDAGRYFSAGHGTTAAGTSQGATRASSNFNMTGLMRFVPLPFPTLDFSSAPTGTGAVQGRPSHLELLRSGVPDEWAAGGVGDFSSFSAIHRVPTPGMNADTPSSASMGGGGGNSESGANETGKRRGLRGPFRFFRRGG